MVNSRNKGNAYERELAKEYRKLGYEDCLTTRNGGFKQLDDDGVDLVYTEPFYIQAKNYTSFGGAKIIDTINSMPEDKKNPFNIVHLKIKNKGEIVSLKKEDWYEILSMLKANDII